MSGFLLHVGVTALCAHGGPAQPTVPDPRVRVSGQPVVTQPNPWVVTGCPFTPGPSPVPCVTAQWVVGALRVRASGQPLLLQSSQAVTVPNGVPINIVATQVRVRGS